MKYGEYLQRECIPDMRAHYIHYKQLRALIEDNDAFDDASFVRAVRDEQRRIGEFCRGKVVEIVNSLQYLQDHEDSALADSVVRLTSHADLFVCVLLKKKKKKTCSYTRAQVGLKLCTRDNMATYLPTCHVFLFVCFFPFFFSVFFFLSFALTIKMKFAAAHSSSSIPYTPFLLHIFFPL